MDEIIKYAIRSRIFGSYTKCINEAFNFWGTEAKNNNTIQSEKFVDFDASVYLTFSITLYPIIILKFF
jgi:hypothetical protein